MICPHCEFTNPVDPETLRKMMSNCERYGSKTFSAKCTNCGKMIAIHTRRVVEVYSVQPSTKGYEDF